MSKKIKREPAVIVTGASTGIGRALAIMLARTYGARIVMNARGSDDLEKAAAAVREAGGQAVTVVGDVSDEATVKQLVDASVETFGGVDILVNNAGLARSGPMSAIEPADWRYVFEVNFFAPLNLTYAGLPHLQKSSCAKIVNVASVAGKVSFPGSICYASSKFALTGFSEGMAAEYAQKNLDVITVCPGWVRTEFFKKNNTFDDPGAIAAGKDLKGWLMRNVLSISSEECAASIMKALQKGGSHEIVLTLPGKFVERLSGYMPAVVFYLSSLVPAERRPKTVTRAPSDEDPSGDAGM